MNPKQATSSDEQRNTPAAGCCGGPAPAGVSACGVDDAAISRQAGQGADAVLRRRSTHRQRRRAAPNQERLHARRLRRP